MVVLDRRQETSRKIYKARVKMKQKTRTKKTLISIKDGAE